MCRAVLLSAFVLLGPALVSTGSRAEDALPIRTVQALPPHDPSQCYCRAQGRMFALGQSVCLRTAEGPRIAECRMVTNVTSWGVTERRCPDS
jgi:hypothetical protein